MLFKLDLSKIKNKKILGIGAHPDDLEFCASGTLLQLSKTNEVSTLVVTDGRMGTHDGSKDNQEIKITRNQENRDAARKMGVKRDIYWDYPDFNLKTYEKNFRKKLLYFLLRERPDIIVTFDPWGRYEPAVHPDHRVLSWAVVEMVLAGTLPLYLKKIGYQGKFLDPSPQIWLMAPASPNVLVDISDLWDEKWKILAVHKSQFDKQVNFEQMKKKIQANMCEPYASENNCKYVETFRILGFLPDEKS